MSALPPLWLAAHLPRLPLDALACEDPNALVTAARGSRRWLIAAHDPQLVPGTELGLARMRRPALVALERQPAREAQALESLACAAYGFGERIVWRIDEPERDGALPRHTLWLEIAGSLRLFGGADRLLARLDEDFLALGHHAAFGIAPTLEAAAALARAGLPPVLDSEALPAALARLPLAALTLSAAAQDWLASLGLQRLGALQALPREGLAARLTRDDLAVLARLSAEQPDPRRPWRPASRFQRRIDFDHELDDCERLLFPLRRLLGELARHLAARATAVQQFRIELAHREQPATVLAISLGTPAREEALLLRVIRERLAALPLAAPVRSLTLVAERYAARAAAQRDFFDARTQTEEAADEAIDRLRARLGAAAVWRPQLVEDHRPERAMRSAEPGTPQPQARPPATPRPVWLLREPQLLDHPPQPESGIERIESGWWDGGDVRRDYYACTLGDGRRGWAYADRRSGRHWLHGLWG